MSCGVGVGGSLGGSQPGARLTAGPHPHPTGRAAGPVAPQLGGRTRSLTPSPSSLVRRACRPELLPPLGRGGPWKSDCMLRKRRSSRRPAARGTAVGGIGVLVGAQGGGEGARPGGLRLCCMPCARGRAPCLRSHKGVTQAPTASARPPGGSGDGGGALLPLTHEEGPGRHLHLAASDRLGLPPHRRPGGPAAWRWCGRRRAEGGQGRPLAGVGLPGCDATLPPPRCLGTQMEARRLVVRCRAGAQPEEPSSSAGARATRSAR